MPCRDMEDSVRIERQDTPETLDALHRARAGLDRVTAMLCGLMTALAPITTQPAPFSPKQKYKTPAPLRIRGVGADGGVTIDLDTELSAWWIKHQQADKRRIEAELRKTALAKLTPEEIRALNLDDEG